MSRIQRSRIPRDIQRTLIANSVLAHRTQSEGGTHHPARFDTDSLPIGINNRCSFCISDKEYHFEDLRKTQHVIKGFGNRKTIDVMAGTLVWKWLDDDRKEHTFRIPNSFYVPSDKMRLLSPQHISQVLKQQGLGQFIETTEGKLCTLQWGDKCQYRKTIAVDPKTNVFTFDLAPGYDNFYAYCAQCAEANQDDDLFEEDLEAPTAMEATM
ncbi:unnamed protein product, partial [Cylindrotheca closterium]